MKKIRFGAIHADYVTRAEALDIIEQLVRSGEGGFVVTPNIDHVVLAKNHAPLRSAYKDASLSLVDGMPLKWISQIVGEPLPEKISGSDFVKPLLQRAAKSGLRVYLLGASPGVAKIAAERLTKEIPGVEIVGVDSPPLGFDTDLELEQRAFDKMQSAAPHIVLMALGCPKQELLMHKWHQKMGQYVYLGIGASLDFVAGKLKRCPPWMAEMGMEWLFRISQDPKRLVHRYFVRDAAIWAIFIRMISLSVITSSKSDIIFYDK